LIENSYGFIQNFQQVQEFLRKLKELPEDEMLEGQETGKNTQDKDCQTDQTTIYCCEQCNGEYFGSYQFTPNSRIFSRKVPGPCDVEGPPS
jgi:hypothetical protein